MKTNLIALLLATSALMADAQTTINGVNLPAKVKNESNELSLNGGGIRKKLFFKLYTAGLYTKTKSNNASQLVNADETMAIRLVITSSVINSSNMSEAIQEGFEKSLKGNTAPLQPKINEFVATFKSEEIKEGDVFEVWYIPGVGVRGYKNGKLKATIPGLDFRKALFGIWLSDDPVDSDLKAALLGK